MSRPKILYKQHDERFFTIPMVMLRDQPKFSIYEREVWGFIRHEQKFRVEGFVEAAFGWIGQRLGISKASVKRAIKKLKKKEWLVCQLPQVGWRNYMRAINPQDEAKFADEVLRMKAFIKRVNELARGSERPGSVRATLQSEALENGGKANASLTVPEPVPQAGQNLLGAEGASSVSGDNAAGERFKEEHTPPYKHNRVGEESSPYEPAAGG